MRTLRAKLHSLIAGIAERWHSSLSVRLVTMVVVVTGVMLALGGMLVLRQASDGLLESKKRSAVAEATSAQARMQTQLSSTDLQQSSIYEVLSQLAEQSSTQPDLYQVIVQTPVSAYTTPGILMESIPWELMETTENSDSMWIASTMVRYSDGRTDCPGLVIGSTLLSPSGDRLPVYFVFPEQHEVETLSVLRNALLSTGVLLLVVLAFIVWLGSRKITEPVREARDVAGRIADGHLNERIEVRGTDELASLGRSMNHMADELDRQITALEELSKVQQQFVSDVSHELRTPMTTAKMASDLLYELREDFDPEVARTTELLHHEIDRFEQLLSELLEISRFDAGAAQLHLEETDLVEVVRREVDEQRGLAEVKGTPLVIHADGPQLAEIDAPRISRIVRNLLTNAIEHGEAHPIDITITGDEHAVAVGVRDHGVGFRQDQSQLVFQRFWRADPSRQRTVGGTGLGLAISRQDADLHHGWLQAWGLPGRGAHFRLTLPRRMDDPLRSSPLPLRPADDTNLSLRLAHNKEQPWR